MKTDFIKYLQRPESHPDPPRYKMYMLYRADHFIAYRPLKEGENFEQRNKIEDWYFEFSRGASRQEISEEFGMFLTRIRPRKYPDPVVKGVRSKNGSKQK